MSSALNPFKWPWQVKAGLSAAVAGWMYFEYWRARARYNAAVAKGKKEASDAPAPATAGAAGAAADAVAPAPAAAPAAAAAAASGEAGSASGGAALQVQPDGRIMLNTQGMSMAERQQLQQMLSLISTGEKLIQLRAFSDAEQCLVSSLEMIGAMLGPNHILADRPFQQLATLYSTTKEDEKALAMQQKSYEIRCHAMGEDSPAAVQVLISMANTLIDLRQYPMAEKFAFRALKVFEAAAEDTAEASAEKHIQIASAKFLIAKIHKATNNLEPAVELLTEVIAVGSEHIGKTTLFTIHGICTLASVYRLLGRFDDAELVYADILAALDAEGMPHSSPIYNAVANHHACMLVDMGQTDAGTAALAEVRAQAQIPPTSTSAYLHSVNAVYFYTLHTQADVDAIARGEEPKPINIGEAIMAEEDGSAPEIVSRTANLAFHLRPVKHACLATMDESGIDAFFLETSLEKPDGSGELVTITATVTRDAVDDLVKIGYAVDDGDVVKGMYSSVTKIYASDAKDRLLGEHHQLVYAPFDLQAATRAQSVSYTDLSSFVRYEPQQ
ncbi:uncharacterized protein AMSG_07831 [Thecamonas trahens ATCC 50062]|uniref:Uncharacterized protein n=1 Tax=Thecamonas trahens ATCC 50062 TaxID=461836 RepID=A0A0L0DK67_THETB|nr:hypothetical protein AMSG_07831 [Thecamonas trahens ATCC 50062]KNC51758.1 hypothetical protein AMSG_07831 [Thecamonas trahens ATCC 50062]|eukprot:XP_013755885.1 hypothetical protein AMSG_07831 [Thecamonas trahens ATCC 50062]